MQLQAGHTTKATKASERNSLRRHLRHSRLVCPACDKQQESKVEGNPAFTPISTPKQFLAYLQSQKEPEMAQSQRGRKEEKSLTLKRVPPPLATFLSQTPREIKKLRQWWREFWEEKSQNEGENHNGQNFRRTERMFVGGKRQRCGKNSQPKLT